MHAAKSILPLALLTMMMGSSTLALASDDDRPTKEVRVIQKRTYELSSEAYVGTGFAPSNSFYRGVLVNAGYVQHFNNTWAWEMLHGSYVFGYQTGLQQNLVTNFGADPEQFPQMQMLFGSSLLIKPAYGKLALFDKLLIHAEAYFVVGAALANFSPTGLKAGPEIGFGIRTYLSELLSLRTEVRDYHFFPLGGSKSSNDVVVNAALAFDL